MPRTAQVRRAPNWKPVSLAAAIPILDVAAIDTEPIAVSDANIDPALSFTNDNTYSTPPISREDPIFNDDDTNANADEGYIYPPPPSPTLLQLPPLLSPLPTETAVLNNDLQL